MIKQTIELPAAAPTLFEMYLDPVAHGEITGGAVVIGADEGCEFRAFDGIITGTILAVVTPVLVVQSWRSANFHSDDRDSTLILSFVPQGKKGRIELVHLDVPDQDYQGVVAGWDKYYWDPWRRHLQGRSRRQR